MTNWGFESGTDGNALTTVNTGWDTVNFSQTSTGEIDTAWAVQGTRSARFIALFNGTNGTCYIQRTHPNAKTVYRFIIAFRPENVANAEAGFMWVGNGSTRGWSIGLQATTNRLIVRDGGGAGGANAWNPTTSIGANNTDDYYLRGVVVQSATVGTMEFELWKEGDSVATASSGLLTNKNTGASSYNSTRIGGRVSSAASVLTIGIDNITIDETTDNVTTTMLALPWQTPPTITLEQPAGNVVSVADSVAGSGTLSYNDPVLQSGPALTWSEVTDGVFVFTQDGGDTDSVYRFAVTQTDTQSVYQDATIPAEPFNVINITAPRIVAGTVPDDVWE